jgi:hypothetical protein
MTVKNSLQQKTYKTNFQMKGNFLEGKKTLFYVGVIPSHKIIQFINWVVRALNFD